MANEINKSEKAKGILAKIAAMFQAAEPPNPLEHKLADGLIFKMDKAEKGGKATIGDKPAEAKTYDMPDGSKITCDAAGMITEITPAPAQKFVDTIFKTVDGQELTIGIEDPNISNLPDVGDKVTLAGAPAPPNDYTLEDGSIITVDATGVITSYTPKPAAAAPDMTTPAGMLAAYNKFATGTIDALGIATILKALMEYCFGWQLREAAAKKVTDDAMAVYQNTLNSTATQLPAVVAQNKQQGEMLKQMFELMTEVLYSPGGEVPGGTPGKKKFSFANTDSRRKTFAKYQEVAKKMHEMEKVA